MIYFTRQLIKCRQLQIRLDINNNPNSGQIEKLKALCDEIFYSQITNDHFGRVKVTSGFRSEQLCLRNRKAQSIANIRHGPKLPILNVSGTDNAELADWIRPKP